MIIALLVIIVFELFLIWKAIHEIGSFIARDEFERSIQ